jgi:hypothetical protein
LTHAYNLFKFPETKISERVDLVTDNKKEPEMKKRGRGRPRKYANDTERIQAFRDRKQAKGRRFDIYVSSKASWRLTKLAEAWGCSRGDAIDRLLMEADQKYTNILFPETK